MDFETRSQSDLKKEGAFKYSQHPTTRATCLAFKEWNVNKIYFFDFFAINRRWGDQPKLFRDMWKVWIKEAWDFSAHNAFFEDCIYENVLVQRYDWPEIPKELFHCTAAKAAACALPRNLEGAGSALNLPVQKDKAGYAAMMATCKPTKQYNDWVKAVADKKMGIKIGPRKQMLVQQGEPEMFLEPMKREEINRVLKEGPGLGDDYNRARIWNTLYKYCKIDVKVEELVDRSLPDLIPQERKIWLLNQKINRRGLRVDVETSRKIVSIMAKEKEDKLKELDEVTMGLVTKAGARKSIIEFLALDDVIVEDIQAKTVKDLLDGDKLSNDGRRLLEIRKALSKVSTRKYQSFIDRSGLDNRVRDILLYHGASTGRDTGSGIQPHNFPRPVISIPKKNPYAPVEDVIEFDSGMLKVLYGDSLGMLFSSILRNMILPSPGCELFVGDYSKIEVAVLWYLADNLIGIGWLKDGLDPYKVQAAENVGVTYEDIDDESDDRQLGKAQILGCGFGMGKDKFKTTAYEMYRLNLTEGQSKKAVESYRKTHFRVEELWYEYQEAMTTALKEQTTTFAGKCEFSYKVDRRRRTQFLWVTLPSGRKLAYANPEIIKYETEFGVKTGLQYWGVKNQKQWLPERTWGGKITENIVQATARDLMAPAMLRCENAGYTALLNVHDEMITEKKIGEGSVEEFIKIICKRPKWADDNLVIEAKGWKGPRYKK